MKTLHLRHSHRVLALWLATIVAPIGLFAQPCEPKNAMLQGPYVTHATGFAGGTPIAVVGITTYDGSGGFSLSATASFNGTIFKGGSGTGTYTINSDCTGSQTFGSEPNTAHYDLVVTPDARQITYIQTDAGTVVTVTSVRLRRSPPL